MINHSNILNFNCLNYKVIIRIFNVSSIVEENHSGILLVKTARFRSQSVNKGCESIEFLHLYPKIGYIQLSCQFIYCVDSIILGLFPGFVIKCFFKRRLYFDVYFKKYVKLNLLS